MQKSSALQRILVQFKPTQQYIDFAVGEIKAIIGNYKPEFMS